MLSEGYAKATADRYWANAEKTHFDMDTGQFEFYARELGALIGPMQGLRILDSGAGRGELSHLFRNAGAAVTATDIAPQFVERMCAEGLEAYTPGNLPPQSRFDAILVNNAFFYVHPKGRGALLGRFRGLLNPGGRLLITDTPDYSKRDKADGGRAGILRRLALVFFPIYQPDMAGFVIDFPSLARLGGKAGFTSHRILDSWSPYRSHIIFEA